MVRSAIQICRVRSTGGTTEDTLSHVQYSHIVRVGTTLLGFFNRLELNGLSRVTFQATISDDWTDILSLLRLI